MSSATAVALTASGIARRSGVRTVDGLRRNSFRRTLDVSPRADAAGSMYPKRSPVEGVAATAVADGSAAPSLSRCRSTTSANDHGGKRSTGAIARDASARRGGDGVDWCNEKAAIGRLAVVGAAAAAEGHAPPLAKCRSLTSVHRPVVGGGGNSSYMTGMRSVAGTVAAAPGEWDYVAKSCSGSGHASGNAGSGGFLAGAMALSAALVAASEGGEETRHVHNRTGRIGSTSWEDGRIEELGSEASGVRCDGAAASSRFSSPLSSFGDLRADNHHHHSQRTSRGNSSGSSGSGEGGYGDVHEVDIDDFRSSCGLEHARPARLITDVYCFQGTGVEVGRGQRSVVSTATHRLTGQAVAVKRLSRANTTRLEVMEEVNMLKVAGTHPNVVSLQAFFEDQDAYYIVMEMCEGGELYHRLADKGRYSEGQAARIMAEVASAVGFLHRNAIVHFDLKPENIMLAVGGDDCVPEVRLADFGSAFRQYQQIRTARDYTAAYSAPEVLARQSVDEKVDMWALGVVMWVLLTGEHPFGAIADLSEAELARRVAEVEPDKRVLRHVSSEGKDLLLRLLARDPEDRPSARQMLSHPWLRAVITRANGKSAGTAPSHCRVHRNRHHQHQRRRNHHHHQHEEQAAAAAAAGGALRCNAV